MKIKVTLLLRVRYDRFLIPRSADSPVGRRDYSSKLENLEVPEKPR